MLTATRWQTRLLRHLPFKRLLRHLDLAVTLDQGRLRGIRWVRAAGVNRFWLGCYEVALQRRFEAAVPEGGVVYDVGAHAGWYTLLAVVCAGPGGGVIACEPLPDNVIMLRRHLALNGLGGVTIVQAAASDRSGTAHFAPAQSSTMGRLAEDGALEVRLVRLDDLADLPAPHVIKIDVEGAELEVLAGAVELLRRSRPVLFVATHGPDRHAACRAWLAKHGYRVESFAAAGEGGPVDTLYAEYAA